MDQESASRFRGGKNNKLATFIRRKWYFEQDFIDALKAGDEEAVGILGSIKENQAHKKVISELANQARLTKPFTDYRQRLLELWSELPDELDKQQKAVVNAIYQVFKYNMKIPPPMIRSLINDIETPRPQTYGSQDFGVLAGIKSCQQQTP